MAFTDVSWLFSWCSTYFPDVFEWFLTKKTAAFCSDKKNRPPPVVFPTSWLSTGVLTDLKRSGYGSNGFRLS